MYGFYFLKFLLMFIYSCGGERELLPSPCKKHKGIFFSPIFAVKSDQAPGGKIHKSVGALLGLV